VIDRVSSLFAGNPSLIQGFNTFLPPGYKIECGVGDDTNTIRVTTPMGSEIRQMPLARPPPPRENEINGSNPTYYEQGARGAPSNWQQGHPTGEAYQQEARAPPYAPHGVAPISPEAQVSQAGPPPQIPPQHEQRPLSQIQNPVPAAPASVRQGVLSPSEVPQNVPMASQMVPGGNLSTEKRGPVEFNHAISYVNKIKVSTAQCPVFSLLHD